MFQVNSNPNAVLESVFAEANLAHLKSKTGLRLSLWCAAVLTGFNETGDMYDMHHRFARRAKYEAKYKGN